MSNRIASAAARVGLTPEATETSQLSGPAKPRIAIEPTFAARPRRARYDDALWEFLAPTSMAPELIGTGDAIGLFDQLIEALSAELKPEDSDEAVDALREARAEWALLDIYRRSLLRA